MERITLNHWGLVIIFSSINLEDREYVCTFASETYKDKTPLPMNLLYQQLHHRRQSSI